MDDLGGKMRHLFYMATIFSFISITSFKLKAYEVPQDKDVLVKIGHPSAPMLPNSFKMLVWNVQKGQGGGRWVSDLQNLVFKHDVIALQEANLDSFSHKVWSSFRDLQWIFATSFRHQNYQTGVMTGSLYEPKGSYFLRSPGREPVLNTPKMTLFTTYQLEKTRDFLVVANVHALNFKMNTDFKKQLDFVMETLAKHHGPILLVGDFNTWNQERLNHLYKHAKALKMQQVRFKNDRRRLVFDHVFSRGATVSEAEVRYDIQSSDHYPLSMNLHFE